MDFYEAGGLQDLTPYVFETTAEIRCGVNVPRPAQASPRACCVSMGLGLS